MSQLKTNNLSLGVVGSRDFPKSKRWLVDDVLKLWTNIYGKPLQIVSGGCRGADTIAKEWALDNNVNIKIHPAMWNTYGKAAGAKRNKLIVNDCNHLIAFIGNKSKGTQITIKFAQMKGIFIWIIQGYENNKPTLKMIS